MGIKMFIFVICCMIVLGGITVGVIEYIKADNCYTDCKSNQEQLNYTNTSGHGINHVCYDECVGGSTG